MLPQHQQQQQQQHCDRYLPEHYVLGEYDVYCGRGSECFQHCGNRRLRTIIDSLLDPYSRASRRGKMDIITDVIRRIRNVDGGGNFVKRDLENWRYYIIGDALAREKVSQAFRDALRDKNRKDKNTNKSTIKSTFVAKKESNANSECYNWNYNFMRGNDFDDEALITVPQSATKIKCQVVNDVAVTCLEQCDNQYDKGLNTIQQLEFDDNSDEDSFYEPGNDPISAHTDNLIDLDEITTNDDDDIDDDDDKIFDILLECFQYDQQDNINSYGL